MGQGWQALSVTMLPGSHPAQDESAPSEARRIFKETHEQTKRAKRIEWVSLVVDVAFCSHFAGFIAHLARALGVVRLQLSKHDSR